MLFQQILNGLTNGSLYALMAVGVTMVYKSLGMLNFAHGDIMMVGTFITLTFITKLGLPFYVSVPLGIICAAGLGFLLERVILRKVKFSSFVNLLIATVGVSYVLRNASMVIWGTNPQLFPSMFPSELIEIGEFRITPQSIGIIIISLAIITGLHFFFTKVKIGKCMQLANSDPEGAAMMGVNVTYILSIRSISQRPPQPCSPSRLRRSLFFLVKNVWCISRLGHNLFFKSTSQRIPAFSVSCMSKSLFFCKFAFCACGGVYWGSENHRGCWDDFADRVSHGYPGILQ